MYLFHKTFKVSLILFLFIFKTSDVLALSCPEVTQIMSFYLRTHYSVHELDKDFSRRTIENYIRLLDPPKGILLEKEKESLIKTYTDSLPLSLARGDCSAIEKIYGLYGKNYEKQFSSLNSVINGKIDYTIDESISFDRKLGGHPKTPEERDEFWRKIVKYQLMTLEEVSDDFKAAQSKLTKRYELLLKDHKEKTLSEIYEDFLSAFAMTLDPHTSYMPPKDLEEFNIATSLSLYGIGALLRSEDGITTVQSLVPGGPAHKAGELKVKDQIIAVGQGKQGPFLNVIDKKIRDVVFQIRGESGTTVRLKVRRGKETHEVSIIRDEISLESQEAKSTSFTLIDGKKNYRVGLIDLPSFYINFKDRSKGEDDYKSSTRDVIREIETLKKGGLDLLILDLRSNPGGSLDEGIDLAGLFTGKVPVVQIKAQSGEPMIKTANTEALFPKDFPVILMINRESASSSEIVAGALKDYDRALLVGGNHTFAKGTVQNFISLDASMGIAKKFGLGGVKFTFSKFYRPLGSSTQLKGVASDIAFPELSDYYEIGEKYYPNPLPWDEIKPVPVKPFNMVSPFKQKLAEASKKRQETMDTFDDIKEAIKKIKEEGLKTKFSLKKDPPKKEGKKKEKSTSEKDKKDSVKDLNKKDLKNPVEEKKKDPKKEAEEKDKKDTEVAAKALEKKEFKPDLNKDSYLLETLYIAGDYIQLLKKQKLSQVSIKDFVREKPKPEEKEDSKKSEKEKVLDPKETPVKKPVDDKELIKTEAKKDSKDKLQKEKTLLPKPSKETPSKLSKPLTP